MAGHPLGPWTFPTGLGSHLHFLQPVGPMAGWEAAAIPLYAGPTVIIATLLSSRSPRGQQLPPRHKGPRQLLQM